MDKNKKDPLRPKEDVKIKDKEKGFLKTLEDIVKKKEKPGLSHKVCK